MKKTRNRIFALLLVLCITMSQMTIQVDAAGQFSSTNDLINAMDSHLEAWNNNLTTFERNNYGGASTCVAFARWMYTKLFGHTNHSSDTKNNTWSPNKQKVTGSDALNQVLGKSAAVGDTVIINLNTSNTHTFIFGGINGDRITVYESGITDNKEMYAANKAWKETYSCSSYLTGRLLISEKQSYTITVIHSVNNILPKEPSRCNHPQYTGMGICMKCGEAFPLSITKYSSSKTRYIVGDDRPDHTQPYGDATISSRYNSGDRVQIVAETVNCFRNQWYQLAGGKWIYGEYLTSTEPVIERTTPRDGGDDGTLKEVSVLVETFAATDITSSDATVRGRVTKSMDVDIETCGVLLGTSRDNMQLVGSDKVTYAANHPKNGKYFDVWYPLNSECSYYLSASTTYYYQFFATYKGEHFWGGVQSFTTPSGSTVQEDSPNRQLNDILVETFDATDITSSDATVRGRVTKPWGVDIETCGVYLGTSRDSMELVGSDKVDYAANHPKNKRYFDVWYPLNAECGYYLSSGTTYYYQFFATYEGELYWGGVRSFTA